MAKTNLIAGLDIGSGKITAAAVLYDRETNSLRVAAVASVSCKGLRSGMVSGIRETSVAVSGVIDRIEEKTSSEINGLYIALRGENIETFTNHGIYNIPRLNKEITSDDIEQAVSNARSIHIKGDHEIINYTTQGFAVDRQRGIINPEGMSGSLLEVDVNITTGLSSSYNNLKKAITQPGFAVDEAFHGIMCLADNVLSNEEKDIGAMLIDMGGETTSVGIYADGALRFSKDFPLGCDLITRDIAYALHTSRINAEEIKKKYGVAFPSVLGEDLDIAVTSLDGRSTNNIRKSFLLDIIRPRTQEIFEQIKNFIDKSGFANMAAVCVLTGGGSIMSGITEQCAQALGFNEARRGGISRDAINGDEEFFDPSYTTALALAIYAAKRDLIGEGSGGISAGSGRFASKIKNIIKDLFSS
ncbi:MAG: cell division protein FtsA [Elusimicrobiota bacterium]|jgi:cell division protein FtsA|nr:cell division protein FtsA [Elusimicrobiota bacterium]